MNPFDIYHWQPPGWPEPRPSVIVSHPDRAIRKNPVEVIMCSTQRATRKAAPHEFILDEADGLDWPTLCLTGGSHRPGRRPVLAAPSQEHDWHAFQFGTG